MLHIRQHWSLVAWMRGHTGLLFAGVDCQGFAGYVPATREAANDSSPSAA